MAVEAPEQLSGNPIRRVFSDIHQEVAAQTPFPPGPGDFNLARTFRFVRDPLPILLPAYQRYGPIFSMRLLHGRVVFMLGPEANHYVTVSHASNFHWRRAASAT